MAWQIPISQSTEVNLGTTDSAYILKGVVVSVAGGVGIFGSGANQQAEVYGSVAGSIGINLGDGAGAGSGVIVGVDAFVVGTSFAMEIYGQDLTLINHGTIDSKGLFTIFLGYSSASLIPTANIVNTGIIAGASIFARLYNADTGLISINNSGTIIATLNVIAPFSSNGSYHVTNSGKISGDMTFAGGEDIYNGKAGHIFGTVSGSGGVDRLTGGTEKNTFDGGAGADTLTGGGGADTFHFTVLGDTTVAKLGRDTITDFSLSGGDRIDLNSFDANTNIALDQAFHFIGAEGFHNLAGELRFLKSATDTLVLGDVNGDGNADFAIKLHGVLNLTAGDFVL